MSAFTCSKDIWV